MAFNERSLDDYVDVAQRIADFREQYPHGSLQPADPAHPWEQAIVTGTDKNGQAVTQTFIVYTAAAYRTPDDERPGIGIAWEIWPGRTPYTRGSEIMNAETSAWGRAIIAVGASDSKRGVRSREEMEARESERAWAAWSGPEPASQDCRDGSHCGPCSGCRCFCHDGYPVNRDGSLSLSKMSDEQRREAGVMTRAEQKEHTALGGGHPGERRTAKAERTRVTRIKAGDVIPEWGDRPLSEDEAVAANHMWPLETEDQPGTISPQQQRAIHAACTGMDRPKRLATIGDIVGRQVASSNELSYTEAALVLGKLSGARA